MARITAGAERRIDASVDDVRAFLTDYERRPEILPENFNDYSVEEGGTGTGTVVTYRMKAGPRERTYRMRVEAADDRVTESDEESSFVTTWTLASADGGTLVRLESTWEGGSGVGGFFERLFAPSGLRRVYDDVLEGLGVAVES